MGDNHKRHLNLDLIRAEVEDDPPTIEVRGVIFTLPGFVPFEVMEHYLADEHKPVLEYLFGDRLEEFKANADYWQVQNLMTRMLLPGPNGEPALYPGPTEGESEASSASSKSTSKRSRQTSKRSTDST